MSEVVNKGSKKQKQQVCSTERFLLSVFDDVRTSHLQFGAVHDDFERYQGYCSRRLRRIRHSLKIQCPKKEPRVKKAPKKPSSTSTHSTTVSEEQNKDKFLTDLKISQQQAHSSPKFMLLLLVEAERAWSLWMQLKTNEQNQQSSTEENIHPRIYYHLVNRVKKAAKWAEKFENLCKEAGAPKTQLESIAYSSWMKGNCFMELRNWNKAIDNFNRSVQICERLSSVETIPERQQMFKDRIEEIAPKLRFCTLNLKRISSTKQKEPEVQPENQKQQEENGLIALLFEKVIKEQEKLHSLKGAEIHWKGLTLPVKNQRVREILAGQQGIGELSEAMQLLKKESGNAEKHKDSASSVIAKHFIDYVNWLKFEKIAKKNLLQIKAMNGHNNKPEETLKLIDSTINALEEAAKLMPGMNANEQKELGKQYAAKCLSLMAERCFYIAETFAKQGKWTEAESLFVQAIKRIQDAKAHHNDCNSPSSEAISELEKLEQNIRIQRCLIRVSALNPSSPSTSTTEIANQESVENNLNVWVNESNEKVVISKLDQIAQSEIIPCRPFFFNLAADELEFPQIHPKKTQPKKSGLFGWW